MNQFTDNSNNGENRENGDNGGNDNAPHNSMTRQYFLCHHQNCLTCDCTTQKEKTDSLVMTHLNSFAGGVHCKNYEHLNFPSEYRYLVERPYWSHSCRTFINAEQKEKLTKLLSIFDQTCKCTLDAKCQLCYSLVFPTAYSPFVPFGKDEQLRLDSVLALFPFIDWNLVSVEFEKWNRQQQEEKEN